jgi:hypothetical protein
MMVLYRFGLMSGLMMFALSLNPYQINWLGLPKSGIISGQVLNIVDDGPIVGALIRVSREGLEQAVAFTDANGFFSIPGLSPADNYDVVAENSKFQSLGIGSVPVVIGNEVTTHFILTPTGNYN